MDAIFEIIMLVIFKIPGAFIRWLLTGCKKPLREFINNGDAYLDGTIGVVFVVLFVMLVYHLFF